MEYDSNKRLPLFIYEFIQLFYYRDLIILMTGNILKNRYKRSILGVLWMLLNPLLQTIVLAIAFGTLFKSSVPGYHIYLLSGLIAWNFIIQTTQYSMSTMTQSSGLLKKIYIPRATYIVASIGNGLVNFLISIFSLFLIIIFSGHPIQSSWFFVPISITLITIFSLGLALLLSAAAVFFVDSIDIYQVVIQASFFLTPIIYPITSLPPQWDKLIIWNPFYYFIEIFRIPIYGNALPDNQLFLSCSLIAILTLLAGWLIFTNKADRLVYHI